MSKIIGLAIKKVAKEPMELEDSAEVTIQAGIVGDCRGTPSVPGKTKRQITVLSEEQWTEASKEVGKEIPWETRRANILIQGLKFGSNDVGKKLHLGSKVILEITGETTPCKRMDEACPGLESALEQDWRGGVTCRVIKGGTISNGDDVHLE